MGEVGVVEVCFCCRKGCVMGVFGGCRRIGWERFVPYRFVETVVGEGGGIGLGMGVGMGFLMGCGIGGCGNVVIYERKRVIM